MIARYLGKDDLNTGEFYQIKIIEEGSPVAVYGAQSLILKYKNRIDLKKLGKVGIIMYKVKVVLEAGDQEVMRAIRFEDGKMANEVYNATNAALGIEAQNAIENARFKVEEK